MKIVIDIPEEDYIRICDEPCTKLGIAVANGTPFSKNYEDLIAEIDKLPRIKVGNSNSPTVKYCIDEVLIYDLLEHYKGE